MTLRVRVVFTADTPNGRFIAYVPASAPEGTPAVGLVRDVDIMPACACGFHRR